MVGYNALLLAVGLTLSGIIGETYFRLTVPFMVGSAPVHFVSKVGLMRKPCTEIRDTNRLDFWTVSRTNSLGFLDREPVSPARAAASCHIAVIGDSFVEAKEVPISDKFQVRLEELAARELPHLDITTSAFGRGTTGQINQLPFYDEYARRLHPKLLVLVFVDNDFMDNSAFLDVFSIRWRLDPEHLPFVYAERGVDGKIKLRPPAPDWASRLPQPPHSPKSWVSRFVKQVTEMSYLAAWLDAKRSALFPAKTDPELIAWLGRLISRPGYETLLDGWRPTTRERVSDEFEKEHLPPVFKEAMEFTTFALEQFKERAERDGASLVILASHRMRQRGGRLLNHMNAMAEAQRIPVIDQYNYIIRQGSTVKDGHWAHDAHWNATGHRWAAEALLEYLKQHPDVCDGLVARKTP